MRKFLTNYWRELITLDKPCTRAEALDSLVDSGFSKQQAFEIQAFCESEPINPGDSKLKSPHDKTS